MLKLIWVVLLKNEWICRPALWILTIICVNYQFHFRVWLKCTLIMAATTIINRIIYYHRFNSANTTKNHLSINIPSAAITKNILALTRRNKHINALQRLPQEHTLSANKTSDCLSPIISIKQKYDVKIYKFSINLPINLMETAYLQNVSCFLYCIQLYISSVQQFSLY